MVSARHVDSVESVSKLERPYQAAMIGLALASVALIALPEAIWTRTTALAIWLVFAIDYAVRLAVARDRAAFVREHLLDLAAIIPLDLISGDEALGLNRGLRAARLVRLVRAGAVLWRFRNVVGGVLGTNGLGHMLFFAVAVVAAGGVAISSVEPEIESFADGLWWSLVTATTVGYGDISPKTAAGRVIAAALMVLGITTFGMVTAALTTYFSRERPTNPHVAAVIGQLERWDSLGAAERRQTFATLRTLVEEDDAGGRAGKEQYSHTVLRGRASRGRRAARR